MKDDKQDLIQLKLRLPAHLHGQLVSFADRMQISLNAAIKVALQRDLKNMEVSREKAKRRPLNLRTTDHMRAEIQAAADLSGKSLTQQVELLIELGLLFQRRRAR